MSRGLRALADEIDRMPVDRVGEALAWLEPHIGRLRREAGKFLRGEWTADRARSPATACRRLACERRVEALSWIEPHLRKLRDEANREGCRGCRVDGLLSRW